MCHLPTYAVLYPASRNSVAWVTASAGNGLLLLVMPFAWLYRPVRNAARLGAHSDRVTKALRNRTPPAASRSRLGDLNHGNRACFSCSFCTTPIASQR